MKRLVKPFAIALVALVLAFGVIGLLGNGVAYAAGENGVRDLITPTTSLLTGVTQTLTAVTGDGLKFQNTGKTFVVINNTSGSTITGTFTTAGTVDGLAIADVAVAVDTGATKIVGPFTTGVFNQPSGTDRGKIYLDWNAAVTGTVALSVTFAAYELN